MKAMTEKKGVFVPTQKIVGMQVIDSKGSSVGTVKDIAVNVLEKKISLVVTTRARSDLDVPWEDITSIVDVVLLRKEVETPKAPEVTQIPVPPPPPPGPNVCPNCGTSAIPTAKFCAKCGTKLK
jgi:sporulation protein YlmC with PRC-barrel domain